MRHAFFLLFLLISIVFAQTPSRAQGDETKIIALENLWNQMQISHDADAVSKLLDSDFVLTDYDGLLMNKAQFLASVRESSNQLTVEVSADVQLHVHGETVVVITGATHEKGTLKGKLYQHQGRFTDTWIKKNGPWLLCRQPAQPHQQVEPIGDLPPGRALAHKTKRAAECSAAPNAQIILFCS